MNGILIMNKPDGFTSHDVVAKLRGVLHTKKIGHGGTLDPMATGVLPVFLGGATKAADYAAAQDKEYVAGFTLGYATDTQDTTGEIVRLSGQYAAEARVRAVLRRALPASITRAVASIAGRRRFAQRSSRSSPSSCSYPA